MAKSKKPAVPPIPKELLQLLHEMNQRQARAMHEYAHRQGEDIYCPDWRQIEVALMLGEYLPAIKVLLGMLADFLIPPDDLASIGMIPRERRHALYAQAQGMGSGPHIMAAPFGNAGSVEITKEMAKKIMEDLFGTDGGDKQKR